jgi:hypothetical protein
MMTLQDNTFNRISFTKNDMAEVMEEVFAECRHLREAGQKEYANGPAFGNFERLAVMLDTPREKVLWTYLMKHIDGIVSWIKGHKSH